jgi:hypothetical protein
MNRYKEYDSHAMDLIRYDFIDISSKGTQLAVYEVSGQNALLVHSDVDNKNITDLKRLGLDLKAKKIPLDTFQSAKDKLQEDPDLSKIYDISGMNVPEPNGGY